MADEKKRTSVTWGWDSAVLAFAVIALCAPLFLNDPLPLPTAVELAMPARGNRGEAQSNAAGGIIGRRQAFRRVIVPGTPREIVRKMSSSSGNEPLSVLLHL